LTPQAVRPARRRWLPPWLPFLLVLLIGAAVVATNVNGQGASPRAAATQASPTSDTNVRMAEISATATVSAPTPTNTAAPTIAPTLAPSATATVQAAVLPPSGARITTPGPTPLLAGPNGPIVAAYTSYASYTVQPGDTLNQVATQFGVNGDTIVRTSGLVDPNLLVPGQVLTIPRDSGWLYRAQLGDTLDVIALRFGLSADDVAQANPTLTAGVHAGDLVFVPDRGTSPKR
jgi:LysM repeat protein